MKKLILLILFATCSLTSFAQERYKAYCHLFFEYYNNMDYFSGPYIDFGQKNADGDYLVEDDGSEIKFGSIVPAMNYMSKKGWIFEYSYTRPALSASYYVVYIFSKEVSTEEDVVKDFYTRSMYKEQNPNMRKWVRRTKKRPRNCKTCYTNCRHHCRQFFYLCWPTR